MNAVVYYFSGSGHSLAAARDITCKLDGKLISIPSVVDQPNIRTEADVIGLVFPVYYAEYRGVPLIVWHFIEKLESLSSKYVFAVATHSGNPATTVEHLAKHLKKLGGKLAGGFTVYMDVPYPVSAKLKKALFGKELNDPASYPEMAEEQAKVYDAWKDKLETIIDYVSTRREGKMDTPGTFAKILISIFLPLRRLMFAGRYKGLAGESRKTFYELVPLADSSFKVNERCNGCGICAKVCPVVNIEIADGKPRWLHRCENCFACFKWCPKDAITGKIVEYAIRNHHPEVGVKDFINQRSGG